MSSQYKLFFDGGKRQNNITYGFVIYKDNAILYKDGGVLKVNASSNAAEYIGLAIGLLHCALFDIKDLRVYGDSLLIISQINGDYQIKSKNLLPYYKACHNILRNFDNWTMAWVPRTANSLADRETRNDS